MSIKLAAINKLPEATEPQYGFWFTRDDAPQEKLQDSHAYIDPRLKCLVIGANDLAITPDGSPFALIADPSGFRMQTFNPTRGEFETYAVPNEIVYNQIRIMLGNIAELANPSIPKLEVASSPKIVLN